MGEGCSKSCSPEEVCGEVASELRQRAAQKIVGTGSAFSFEPEEGPDWLRCGGGELTCKRFGVIREPPLGASAPVGTAEWCRYYSLGGELGSGQSAVAFQGFALGDASNGSNGIAGFVRGHGHCTANAAPPCEELPQPRSLAGPRTVTLKRFRMRGSVAFRQELKLLSWVGPHAHVLRLLEAFQGQEDVLVLEYCELGDMYEYYVRTGQAGMSEAHAAELARQLLLALSHLAARRVEHRDVKPENLMLFHAADEFKEVPLLKLGDFGWANISVWGEPPSVPTDGCGSLWYAPPELNPPVAGAPRHELRDAPLGSCDIWSLGVITYLLLCGHSPFHKALRIRDAAQREQEILRMAAMGEVSEQSPNWQRLSLEARNFCRALLKVPPGARLTLQEALAHPFIRKAVRAPRCSAVQDLYVPDGVLEGSRRRQTWASLDGLQQLCWLAVAAAVSEHEVIGGCGLSLHEIAVRLHGMQGESSYLEELAVELATSARPSWFSQEATVWHEVLCLAFRYLDVGGDGLLSAEDLVHHLLGSQVSDKAGGWVQRWRRKDADVDVLYFDDFCMVLEVSMVLQARLPGDGADSLAAAALPEWARGALGGRSPAANGHEDSAFAAFDAFKAADSKSGEWL